MRADQFGEESPGEIVTTEEGYTAFNPDPLPPDVDMNQAELFRTASKADQAVGELAGIGRTVDNPHMLIRPFIRKEAVSSSQIEGTTADLDDVYAYEAGQESLIEEPQRDETEEVYNYVRAIEYGLEESGPINLELICELHRILLQGVRGQSKKPGELRDVQNFIGGHGDTAKFVPPPPRIADFAMQDLEEYLQGPRRYPDLVELAILHYQFETIHPFLDGNGRIGRLLISLLMCEWGLLPQPLLYISTYFRRHRSEYEDRLFDVSANGAWEEWIRFFLQAVEQQAKEAFLRSNELLRLKENYRQRYQDTQSQTLPRLVDAIFSTPVFTVNRAAEMLDVSYPAANKTVKQLQEDGILVEMTGKSRGRLFRAEEIYEIIRKPLEDLESVDNRAEHRQARLTEDY